MINWTCQVSKYRISPGCSHESSNASDAASFHRDIMLHTKHNVPIYTFIIYLDDSLLKIIPKSHNHLRMNFIKFSLSKTNTLKLKSGDAILINAALLHCGVFNNIKKNRRVIQLFDVFPSEKIAMKYSQHIAHVHYNKFNSNIGSIISKISHSKFSWFVKKLSSLVTSNGYGYNTFKNDYNIISGESYRSRLSSDKENIDKYFMGNLYVIYTQNYVNTLSENKNNYYRSIIYDKIYINYFIQSIIYILLLFSILYCLL